ncbi:MAG: hypothetical protein ACI841_001899 [Planctomycetota bacterium]|jgi:hypothetical protein
MSSAPKHLHHPQPRGLWRALAILLLATTLIKLALILAPPADLYLVGGSQSPVTWIGEEAHRGTTALDFLTGRILSLLDYQYAPFFGGALVVSVVAMPFFAWLGPSVSALKMTGLVFNGFATLFLFLALDRCLGRRAAWFGAFLFALSPPGYSILAITAFGSHVETNAFAMAAFYFSVLLMGKLRPDADAPDDNPPSRLIAGLLGFTAGFGIYFSYIVMLSLAAIGATWILGGRLRRLRAAAPAIIVGFLMGLAPWLAFNVPRSFPGMTIYGRSLGNAGSAEGPSALARMGQLLSDGYPGSFFFSDYGPISGRMQGLLSAFLVIGLALAAFCFFGARSDEPCQKPAGGAEASRDKWRSRLGHPALALLIQPLLFLLAYGFTGFKVGDEPHAVVSFRYVYATFPFLAGAAGCTLARIWSMNTLGPRIATVVTLLLVAPAAIGTARLVDLDRWGSGLEEEGYSYSAMGRFLVMTFHARPETVVDAVERAYELRSEEDMHEMLFGMSMQMRQLILSRKPLRARMKLIQEDCPALLRRVRECVREEHAPYFEELTKKSRLYRHDQREMFWSDFRERRKS